MPLEAAARQADQHLRRVDALPVLDYHGRMVDAVANAQDVRDRLKQHAELLSRYAIASIAVFGSVARAEASAESDVDLLVTFGRPTGAFAVLRLERELEGILGRQVEIVTPAALKPALRDRVVAEAVDAA